VKPGVAGCGATPDSAPTPTRLIAMQRHSVRRPTAAQHALLRRLALHFSRRSPFGMKYDGNWKATISSLPASESGVIALQNIWNAISRTSVPAVHVGVGDNRHRVDLNRNPVELARQLPFQFTDVLVLVYLDSDLIALEALSRF
jgi:hypothetical protein